ncbi:MAG: type II toxin-antitoxin system RelE/ParE family toxin [bacterium]|nr:type II toxin-antitoxin system RelE/ParE family toxin [bacterium]
MRQKKQLKNLDKKKEDRLKEAIKFIAQNPSKGKKLKGELKGVRSYRVGKYRIIYRITEEEIDIVSIVHRKDAY